MDGIGCDQDIRTSWACVCAFLNISLSFYFLHDYNYYIEYSLAHFFLICFRLLFFFFFAHE